ncbi:MAG: OsmC family protein [Alphaproteobacteria bacterium]
MTEKPVRAVHVASIDGGLQSNVRNARGQGFLADEPVHIGGAEEGMTPFELLIASLASCTSATLAMYAGEKGVALRGVTIDADYTRAGEDGLPADGPDRIRRKIMLAGDLDEAAIVRLTRVAQHCPVHKAIVGDRITCEDEIVVGEPAP